MIEIENYLQQKGIKYKPLGEELIIRQCLFCKDEKWHLYINRGKGMYFCHKCGEKGSWRDFQKACGDTPQNFLPRPQIKNSPLKESLIKVIPEQIKKYHQDLPERIRTYLKNRGIKNKIVNQQKIGRGRFYKRYWIAFPVWDKDGKPLFLKLKKDPEDKRNPDKSKYWPPGHSAELYGCETLKNKDKVIICEGEPDRLLLLSKGFPAVCSTGGAGTFKEEWKEYFKKTSEIFIIYDNDKEGINGAKKVARIFGDNAKIVFLPEEVGRGGDLTDYFIRLKHGTHDFNALLKKAKTIDKIDEDDIKPKRIHLLEIEDKKLLGQYCSTEIIIGGVSETYHVPSAFKALCPDPGDQAVCVNCPLRMECALEIPNKSGELIELCNRSQKDQKRILAEKAIIKANCNNSKLLKIKITERETISELLVMPKVSEIVIDDTGKIVDEKGQEYRDKAAYLIGRKESEADAYLATGYPLPHPRNSSATFLITKMRPLREEFEDYEIKDPKIFKPLQVGKFSVEKKVEELGKEICERICGLKGNSRKDSAIVDMITWHSVLSFRFDKELVEQGWVETAKLGDTTTGKSQGDKKEHNFLGLGMRMEGETSARTGFLYGIDTKTLGKNILKWGMLPLSDKRLLSIDGSNYLGEEWGLAREARRSGLLKVRRIVSGDHPCRTRIIAIANPPRSLNEYLYPVISLKSIFGEPDIARFDIVTFFSSNDVSSREINIPSRKQKKIKQRISRQILQENVRWAWSRGIEDIDYTDEAVEETYKIANRLTDKYRPAADIPLIGDDTRFKIARISTGLAGFLHSTDKSHKKIIVQKEHVLYTEKLIDRIYSRPNCRLDEYAQIKKEEKQLSPEEFEKIKNDITEKEKKEYRNIIWELIKTFKSSDRAISQSELIARLGIAKNTLRDRINLLKKHDLIKSAFEGYKPTVKFILFMRKLEEENNV